MVQYGSASAIQVDMLGPFGSNAGTGGGKIVEVFLPLSEWKGAASPYSQVVSIEAATVNTKVDIQAGEAVHTAYQRSGIHLVAVNDGGVVTVFSFGDKPSGDITVQATLTEVTIIVEDQRRRVIPGPGPGQLGADCCPVSRL